MDITFTTAFSQVIRDFQARDTIHLPDRNACNNCTFSAPGFGFTVDCTSLDNLTYDLSPANYPTVIPSATVFESSVTIYNDEVNNIRNLNVTIVRKTRRTS
ncbi:hypothetical protein B0T25DRAFT_550410 [Lasiosphaeria hispida]|uniref:Uncharacterized protein n=1 Tax=Lasiosphaeria hispida TaxID=260671 RepID=A0AAJ0HA57_9PEZI|nr:hypothetical protein B0T25DRAFT_550410 [Lasiosphaeria hispida]